MNIALDGRQHDLVLLLSCFPGGLHLVFDDLKRRFCRLRTHQKLRQKDGALLKAIAYSVQRRDQRGVDDIQRLTHRQGSIGGGTGLCL